MTNEMGGRAAANVKSENKKLTLQQSDYTFLIKLTIRLSRDPATLEHSLAWYHVGSPFKVPSCRSLTVFH